MSYWKPDDKQWMKQRKEEWRIVKQSLDVISSGHAPFKRNYHNFHKDLFFYGAVEKKHSGSGHKAFLYSLPMFQIWYHPDTENVSVEEVLQPFVGPGRMANLRKSFFETCFNAGQNPVLKMFSPVTGMMNGREEQVVKYVCPGYDYKDTAIQLDNPGRSKTGQEACFWPPSLRRILTSHTRKELIQDARFVPFAPGQYLWDHLSYMLEHYYNEVFELTSGSKSKSDEIRNTFLELIAEILAFEKRTDKSRRRPSTIALVERLFGQYESKSFSDPMLKLWEEAKKNINNLLASSAPQTFHSPEELEKNDFMPIEVQEERVSQWKQV